MSIDHYEITGMNDYISCVADGSLPWQQTEADTEWCCARRSFFDTVKPVVVDLIQNRLTRRQREVVSLYYLHGKTQVEVATILHLNQSTVSRALFGIKRNGRNIGGAVPKLRRIIESRDCPHSIIFAQRDLQVARERVRNIEANSLF